MELRITDDQDFFAETTRKFLEDKTPVAELRAKRHDPVGYQPEFWPQGAELGWTSLLVSEEDGGGSISGEGVKDLALVAHEFGRHAAPGPLLTANVVAAALSRSGTAEQKEGPLAEIIAGEVASWAHAEPRPNEALGTVTATLSASGDGYTLTGVKAPVEHGSEASYFLVSANSDGGLTQVLVPANAQGVTVTPMSTLDLTRRFAQVSFDSTPVPASAVVGTPGQAAADLERQLQLALVIQTNEMVGAMDKALEITIEWAFDRYSFGRPLASYQELKHRFADMKMWLEASHALANAAATAVQNEDDNADEMVSAAKAYIGQNGPELCQDCVQMHGGIGVTFEHDMHLYLRRVVLGAGLHGTVADHRLRLTDILEQREEAAA